MVSTNSRLMAETFLRPATSRPVRYSAKWTRSGSLAKDVPKLGQGFLDDGWKLDDRWHTSDPP